MQSLSYQQGVKLKNCWPQVKQRIYKHGTNEILL
jgi:hypothetical protein